MKKRPVSLLQTTQNTRDLGGYRTENNSLTLSNRLLRSDIQKYGDTNNYFKGMGLSSIEIEKLRKKLYEY